MDSLARFTFPARPATRSDGHEHDVGIFLAEGRAVFECGGVIEVVAPSLYFIPAGAPHGFLEAQNAAGWTIVGAALQVDAQTSRRALPVPRDSAHDLGSWLERIVQERDAAQPHAATAIAALRTLVTVEISRVCRESTTAPEGLIDAATSVIASHASGPFRPRDVAKMLGVSAGHLSHEMTRATGRTVTQWIAEARIARVKELLVGSNATLAQIAESLHYPDATQLAREFKRVTGMPPGAWRANSANRTAK